MDLWPTQIDGPVAVVGDVHGQAEKLDAILRKLEALPGSSERWIVFIGDFVDRGPDPAAVTETVLQLMRSHGRVAAVCGNHELAMCGSLHLFQPPDYADWAERWVGHYDAHTTFESYGAEFGDMPALLHAIPELHRQFYSQLPWCVEHPDYLFVHAGLETHQPYAMQLGILRARDFSLTRPPWLCSHTLLDSVPADAPVTVVSGHVYVPEVRFGDRRLLVDTTGGIDGELSCVLLPENIVLNSGADVARSHASAPEPQGQSAEPSATRPAWWKLW